MSTANNATSNLNTRKLILFAGGQAPGALWLLHQDITPDIIDLTRVAGLFMGVTAVTFLALSLLLVLPNRWDFHHALHHFSGGLALVFVSLHVMFLAIASYTNSPESAQYLFAVWDQSLDILVGWIGFIVLVIVVFSASLIHYKSRYWHAVHRVSIIAYALVFYHYYSLTTSNGLLYWLCVGLFIVGALSGLLRVLTHTVFLIALTYPISLHAEESDRFSPDIVAAHNTKDDCWLIIHKKVYDVTSYIPRHPAKPETIVNYCGKDATEAYMTKNKNKPHSKRADARLPTYYIGDLETVGSSQ